MGWFKSTAVTRGPTPMSLRFGEPIHQMVARALLCGAVKIEVADTFPTVKYHFTGDHGVEYRNTRGAFCGLHEATEVAKLCEKIQQDFNERCAAMTKAREYAREQLSVPPLFAPTGKAA